jgi:hypothetical protein
MDRMKMASELLAVADEILAGAKAVPRGKVGEKVRELASRHISWFDFDGESNGEMAWSTRDDGDIENEEPGLGDIRGAKDFVEMVKREVRGVKAWWETTDEWVSVRVKLPGV